MDYKLPVIATATLLFLLAATPFQTLRAQSETSEFANDTTFIKEVVLAKNVVERTPRSIVQSFDVSDEQAWCFARIYNNRGLINVTFRWFYEDSLYYEFDAKVGNSDNWRTYSSVTLREGLWRVEIVGPTNKVLKEIRFQVSDSQSDSDTTGNG